MRARSRKKPKLSGKARRSLGFAFIEVALASVIVSLLILSFLAVLNITMEGTISAKWRNQAHQLAKDRIELIKADLLAVPWEDILVDMHDNDYNAYPPVTVVLGSGQSYVVDPTVRFVDLHGYDSEADPSSPDYAPTFIPPDGNPDPDMGEFRFADGGANTWSANHIVYVPTPRPSTADTEYAEVVMVRVDVYWSQGSERIADIGPTTPPHPFEGMNTTSLENLVASRKIKAPSGTIQVYAFENPGTSTTPVAGANVYLYRGDTMQQIDLITSSSDGSAIFENVPASPPNYFIVSKNNEGLQYGDDLSGPSGQPGGGYVVVDGENEGGPTHRLRLDKLTGGTVTGLVRALDPVGNTINVQGAVVVCNDLFSGPTTTDVNGEFFFENDNQVQIGLGWEFSANVYSSSQTFLVDGGSVTAVGAQGAPVSLDVGAGTNGPITLFLDSAYEKTYFVVRVQDSDGNCLGSSPPTSFPVTVQVSDGSPFTGLGDPAVIGNLEEDDNLDCYVTLGLVTGTHATQVFVGGNDPRNWQPITSDILYDGAPGALVTIGNGVPPTNMPDVQSVATASGSVTGFTAPFDYSVFQVGLYTADPAEDLVYSFPLEANGLIRFQDVPVAVNVPTDYHIKLITGPEYSTDPNKLSNISFSRGVTTVLTVPTFTVFKDVAYVTGIVKNSNDELISTGVMILAVPTGQAEPALLNATQSNVWSATSTEDGRYMLPLPVAVSGSTYDLYGYHLPRKVDPGGIVAFTSTSSVAIPGVGVVPANSLSNPLTVDFSGATNDFDVTTGFH